MQAIQTNAIPQSPVKCRPPSRALRHLGITFLPVVCAYPYPELSLFTVRVYLQHFLGMYAHRRHSHQLPATTTFISILVFSLKPAPSLPVVLTKFSTALVCTCRVFGLCYSSSPALLFLSHLVYIIRSNDTDGPIIGQ